MARPTKDGLDYFPLVTNFEDKMILLIAEFGASAVGIVVSLYQKIYDNGYYIDWNEDSLMLFSRYVNEEIEKVNTVITRCFDRDVFNKAIYEKYGILTSHGIQKQYLRVCKEARRKRVGFIKEYCLVKNNDLLKVITEFTLINTEETPRNDSDNTQSKVKESKVKESTRKILSTATPYDDIIQAYHLCCPSLPKIKKLTEKRKKIIRARWRADPDIEVFCALFRKAETSDFLTGRNGRWTSCNFDWLVNEANMVKVLEGNYDNKSGGASHAAGRRNNNQIRAPAKPGFRPSEHDWDAEPQDRV